MTSKDTVTIRSKYRNCAHQIPASNLEEAREYILQSETLPKGHIWEVFKDGINLGYGVRQIVYKLLIDGSIRKEEFNYLHLKQDRSVFTKERAEEQQKEWQKKRTLAAEKAKVLLDEYEDMYKKLPFKVSYCMEGDTHGIYEDYMYIEVIVDGFNFERKIDDQ